MDSGEYLCLVSSCSSVFFFSVHYYFFFYRKQSFISSFYGKFVIFDSKQNTTIKKSPFFCVFFLFFFEKQIQTKKQKKSPKTQKSFMLNVIPLTSDQNLGFVFKRGIFLCPTVFMTKEYICFLPHCCGVITCNWLKQMESALLLHTHL